MLSSYKNARFFWSTSHFDHFLSVKTITLIVDLLETYIEQVRKS